MCDKLDLFITLSVRIPGTIYFENSPKLLLDAIMS